MPPPELPFNSISWKVITKCNYRCSYCLQPSFGDGYPEHIEATVDEISRQLVAPYEIKIAGGEIVADAGKAMRLVAAIEENNHWLSLCSNFCADVNVYRSLIDAMNGRFYNLQVSLHLEYASADAFLEKCLSLMPHMPAHSKLVVNNVIQKGVGNIEKLSQIKSRFESEGITFYTDLLVDKLGNYVSYTDEEARTITRLLGDEQRYFESQGKHCRAGHSYFVLLPNLDVWSCWDAYFQNKQSMYLGSIPGHNFKPKAHPVICPFKTCSCPTPMIKHGYKLEEFVTQQVTK